MQLVIWTRRVNDHSNVWYDVWCDLIRFGPKRALVRPLGLAPGETYETRNEDPTGKALASWYARGWMPWKAWDESPIQAFGQMTRGFVRARWVPQARIRIPSEAEVAAFIAKRMGVPKEAA